MLKFFKVTNALIQDLIPKDFPEGNFRLDNAQEVFTPQEADVVTLPWQFREYDNLTPTLLHQIITKFNLDERRVACFDVSDFDAMSEAHPNVMVIRCNLKPIHKKAMPRSICVGWPVENYAECVDVPADGFKYDISARMWLSGNVRIAACESVQNTFGNKADMETYSDFTGYIYDQPEGVRRRQEFRRSMRESRVALCPRSISSVHAYRSYEAMSAGRVPIIFCNDPAWPWANKIDYASCVVHFRDEDAVNAGPLIRDWLDKHTDAQIIEMGKRGRAYWEEWLNREKNEALFTIAIEERLRMDGLL